MMVSYWSYEAKHIFFIHTSKHQVEQFLFCYIMESNWSYEAKTYFFHTHWNTRAQKNMFLVIKSKFFELLSKNIFFSYTFEYQSSKKNVFDYRTQGLWSCGAKMETGRSANMSHKENGHLHLTKSHAHSIGSAYW